MIRMVYVILTVLAGHDSITVRTIALKPTYHNLRWLEGRQ